MHITFPCSFLLKKNANKDCLLSLVQSRLQVFLSGQCHSFSDCQTNTAESKNIFKTNSKKNSLTSGPQFCCSRQPNPPVWCPTPACRSRATAHHCSMWPSLTSCGCNAAVNHPGSPLLFKLITISPEAEQQH